MKRQALDKIPPELLSPADYSGLSREFIDHSVYEYIAGGAGNELTASRNRQAFDRLVLCNRVLMDFSQASTGLTLLGQSFQHPILLAPVAHQKLVHPQGEKATVAAASAVDAGFVASTLSSFSLEDIAATGDGSLWFQLYYQRSREQTLALVRRAENAGYSALVVTVDVPVNALRHRAQRAGFRMPADLCEANLVNGTSLPPRILAPGQSVVFDGLMADAPSWGDIRWLQQNTDLPLLIKGIINPRDALAAANMGVAGVIVSNHGGRSLDGLPASITALPAVRKAVGPNFPLLLDSGIRSGSDVFKALACGANAVLVGQLQVHALAVAGALGVAHMLRLMKEELEVTMALAGCPTLGDINADCLFT
ncbi:MAG: hypothetical protein VR73_08975 [Gammaproteobacteria bacterium BRH_c0]|nr:MAG: hypothetical protein VR73_08975 [Gammaproteobacteria bacterium BRH_c0]